MKLGDFDYNLPKNLIAQKPTKPRDHSRLLVLNKTSGQTKHKYFYDIVNYLKAGDVLVLNNSKVFPARLIGKKAATGGKIEVFLLNKTYKSKLKWRCLLGGRGCKEGVEIEFKHGLICAVIKDNKNGTWEVKFNQPNAKMMDIVKKIGLTPLPPYIKRNKILSNNKRESSLRFPQDDRINYQTIYADDKKIGSVAAPTAGLHFTPALMTKLKKKGVQFEYITLHVGLGTFAPVKSQNIIKHKMHSEWVEASAGALKRIIKAKKEGRRIIAVGTTSIRSMEAGFLNREPRGNFKGWVNIFIYPGYKFKVVDGLITNFHLPKSTLLMLVSAFTRKGNIDKAYKEAIKKKYRFYSYGDAMFIC